MHRSWLNRFTPLRCAGLILLLVLGFARTLPAQSISLGPLSVIDGADEGSGGDTGLYADFQNDANGGQHVVYYDQTNGNLRYAHRGSTARPWELQTVDSAGNVGVDCEMDLGPERVVPMTATFVNGSDLVTVNTVFSLPFVKEMVGGRIEPQFGPPTPYEVVEFTSATQVRISPAWAGGNVMNGAMRTYYYQPTIAYQDLTDGLGKLKVAIPDNQLSWRIEEVSPGTDTTVLDTGYKPSIGVSPNFDLHVAFQDRTTTTSGMRGVLKYAYKPSSTGAWQVETRDSSIGAGANLKTIINRVGKPIILYADSSDENLYAQTRVDLLQAWLTGRTYVDDTGSNIGLRAIDMDYFEAGTRIMFVYQDQQTTGSSIDRITFGNAIMDPAGIANWNLKLEPLIREGIASHLSVSHGLTTGTMEIAFYDDVTGSLRLLEGNGVGISNFKPEVILDPGPQAGKYCSADHNNVEDQLYIAYYNADIGGLQMLGWDGSAVTGISFIDGQKVGRFSDLTYTDTEIIVAYHHDAEGSLRVARWPVGMEPSDGTNVVVDNSSADVGEYCSVTADSDGRIFVAYYDRTNTNLKYAAWDGLNWNTRTIVGETTTTQPQVDVGQFCQTMVFETTTSQKLGVAFYDATNKVPVFGEAVLPPYIPGNLTFNFLQQPMSVDAGSGRYLSMDYSTSGVAQLAFYNEVTRTPDFVESGGVVQHIGYDPQLPFDVNGWYTAVGWNPLQGRAEVAFYDISNGQLKYAIPRGSGNWDIEVLDDFGDTGYYNQLRFDPVSQYTYLISYNQTLGELFLVHRPWTGTAWSQPIPINGTGLGIYHSFEPDVDGKLLMSFHQLNTADLIFTVTTTPPNITASQHFGGWE